MAPTIHLVRHAQGLHNLSVENESLRDPDLTPLGNEQCAARRADFGGHQRLGRLVASPLRRAIKTGLGAFGSPSLGPVVALGQLQEVSDAPCDTGIGSDAIAAEFGPQLDLSRLRSDYSDKGPGSYFEPNEAKLVARAKDARRALRDLAAETPDRDLAAVSHGAFLHFLTEDWEGIPANSATGWDNCELRSYQFLDPSGQDPDATLVETEESRRRRGLGPKPLPAAEQKPLQERVVPFMKLRR